MKNVPLTLPLLKKLEASGFNVLVAYAQADNRHLIYVPSKQVAELADDAEVIAPSSEEVFMIKDLIEHFDEYRDKGIAIEMDEGV